MGLSTMVEHASGKQAIRPRARLLKTIGAELISSEIVAVLELVRNCYDADATCVTISLDNPENPEECTLEIHDDGHGMTREIFLGPWLEPATDHKLNEDTGPGLAGQCSPGGRRRLGSKGVGRFAAQRLGSHLRVQTETVQEALGHNMTLDWIQLDRVDSYLDELSVDWKTTEKGLPNGHGTMLMISGMLDTWDLDRRERLHLALSRLVGPGLENDRFDIFLEVNGSRTRIEPAVDAIPSMYSIRGRVELGGQVTIEYRDALTEEAWERVVEWSAEGEVAGAFEFRLSAWDLDRDALGRFLEDNNLTQYNLRDFRRLIRDVSGMSLYRDGFRILPYGEPGNDWLQLDRRRVNNPTMRLSNNQILGWIKLSADGNPDLKDQTNREGLVTNEAYRHLKTVVLDLVALLETRRFQSRRSMGITIGRATGSLPALDRSADEELQKVLSKLEAGQASNELMKQLRGHLDGRRQILEETIRLYGGLAASGQMAGLVFGQLSHLIRQVSTELKNMEAEVRNEGRIGSPGTSQSSLRADTLETFDTGIRKSLRLLDEMEQRAQKVDPLASVRMGRRSVKTGLHTVLRSVLVDVFGDETSRLEINTKHGCNEVELSTDPQVVGQVAAILIKNAIYWLSMKPGDAGERCLWIAWDSSGFQVQNNGPGIPESHLDEIFDAHFTTRNDAAGMGLALARDLLKGIGGTITLANHADPVLFSVELSSSSE